MQALTVSTSQQQQTASMPQIQTTTTEPQSISTWSMEDVSELLAVTQKSLAMLAGFSRRQMTAEMVLHMRITGLRDYTKTEERSTTRRFRLSTRTTYTSRSRGMTNDG